MFSEVQLMRMLMSVDDYDCINNEMLDSKFRIRGKKSGWRVGGVTRFRELRVKMEGSESVKWQ